MGIIEVLVGVVIITVGILALIQAFNVYVSYALANDKNAQAAYLLEEPIEVMSLLRDSSWNTNIKTLSTTTTYYIAWNATVSAWTTTTTPQYVDEIFLRKINLSNINRDSTGHIVTTGGTYDPNSLSITVSLSYFVGHATTTQTLTTYITNLYNN